MQKRHMIAYSAGSLGAALAMQCFNTFAPIFYIDTLKMAPALFGIAMTIYAIWNAINDPLAGQISDRTRTRWGRRVPYIKYLTVPLVLCFVAVWVPPFRVDAGQMTLLFAYFLFVILAFDTVWTFVVLNWTALFPEMYSDFKQRAEVSGWRQVFSVIGVLLGVAAPPLLYSSIGWGWTAVIFGIITGLSFLISLTGSREKEEFSREPALSLRQALAATFKNRSFLLFLVINIFVQFVFEMLTASMPFYAKYVLGVGDMETSALLGTAFIVAMPMLYVWTKATQKYGARTTLLLGLVVFALGLLPFLVASSFVTGLLCMAATGVGLAAIMMLTDLLIADIVDEDELTTGRRREGMYFGMNGFMIRLGIALKAIVLSTTLQLGGYDAYLSEQPAAAVVGMRLLVTLVPIVALAAAFVGAWVYPLHGARLGEVRERVAELHARKGAV
ncbi:MAG TPA: MFS transporter [Anaerolineae bacterium]|nr:MFS transporter [Anaerolineae bacterium]